MEGSGDVGGDIGVADAMPGTSIVEADAGPDFEIPESTDGIADAGDFAEVAAEGDAAMTEDDPVDVADSSDFADVAAERDAAMGDVADAGDLAAQSEEQQLAAV